MVPETNLGLDQRYSFGNTNNKGFVKLGFPETERNLYEFCLNCESVFKTLSNTFMMKHFSFLDFI